MVKANLFYLLLHLISLRILLLLPILSLMVKANLFYLLVHLISLKILLLLPVSPRADHFLAQERVAKSWNMIEEGQVYSRMHDYRS
mgnify:CR=1 FL=1